MWLTGLMCGLRPGELAGLRWPFVDIDSDAPSIEVAERALEVEDRYVGQAAPKTERGKRRIGLHCAGQVPTRLGPSPLQRGYTRPGADAVGGTVAEDDLA
jgi:integrase